MPNTSANFQLSLSIQNTLNMTSNGAFGAPSFAATLARLFSWSSIGSGANQINMSYVAERTVSNGTPDTIDLNAGTIKQPDGVTSASFADIVFLAIVNNSTTAGQNLQIGGGTNNVTTIWGASGVDTLLPGAVLLIATTAATGWVVTPATADILTINVAAGTSVPYSIAILGH